MADEADNADQRIEDAINDAIGRAQREAAKPPQYFNECNWCGDPTEGGARYCTKDCANDAFRYNATLKRNGINCSDT
jgi:hypothetical protein